MSEINSNFPPDFKIDIPLIIGNNPHSYMSFLDSHGSTFQRFTTILKFSISVGLTQGNFFYFESSAPGLRPTAWATDSTEINVYYDYKR